MSQDLVFHLRGVLAGLEVLLGGLEGALDVLRLEQLGRSFETAVVIVVEDELPLFRPWKEHPMNVQHSRSDGDVQYVEFCGRLRIADRHSRWWWGCARRGSRRDAADRRPLSVWTRSR